MIRNMSKVIFSSLCMIALFCLCSCSMANIDLCYDEHPHKGQMIVEYDWSGLKMERPDSMIVIALRPVFRDKVSSNWATEVCEGENRLYGRLIAPMEEKELYSNQIDNAASCRDSLFLPTGEWVISSFSYNAPTIDLVKGYTEDIMDDGESLLFKTETYNDLPLKYSYWYDRNPYRSWINVTEGSSICMAKANLYVDEYASINRNYRVRLRPSTISQKINFSFDAEVSDDNVIIDSVVCAVSGIPNLINMQTLEMEIDSTYQGIFETNLSKTVEGYTRVSGTIYATGLVRSTSQSLLHGPGILNVSVFVHYPDANNRIINRRLDATTNLYWLLTDNPSVRYNERGKVEQAVSELNLHIRSRLLVSKSKLSNANDALDAWNDETIIEADSDKDKEKLTN